jgi:hypothetical protein
MGSNQSTNKKATKSNVISETCINDIITDLENLPNPYLVSTIIKIAKKYGGKTCNFFPKSLWNTKERKYIAKSVILQPKCYLDAQIKVLKDYQIAKTPITKKMLAAVILTGLNIFNKQTGECANNVMSPYLDAAIQYDTKFDTAATTTAITLPATTTENFMILGYDTNDYTNYHIGILIFIIFVMVSYLVYKKMYAK